MSTLFSKKYWANIRALVTDGYFACTSWLFVHRRFVIPLALGIFILVGVATPIHKAEAAFWFPFMLIAGTSFLVPGLTGVIVKEGAVRVLSWVLQVIEIISAHLVTAAVLLFDWVIEYTVHFNFLATPEAMTAVSTGWGIVRDFMNIFFIFALLFMAIATILQIDSYGWKRLLARLIIIALLINFSLFLTRVVIDASNLFASQFYDRFTPSLNATAGGRASIGTTILSATSLKDAFTTAPGNKPLDNINVSVVLFMQITFNLITAWVFFSAALLFVGRFVIFIFLMVLSPAAFFLSILPSTKKYFDDWLNLLINQALVAPVFLFFILVILSIATAQVGNTPLLQIVPGNLSSTGNTNFIVNLFFNWVIIIGMLYGAIRITRDLSGKVGQTATKFGKMGLGYGAAAAFGGASILARGTIGRASQRIAQSGFLKKAASKSFLGKAALKTFQGVGRRSFDVRGIPGAGAGAKALGLDLGKAVGKGGREAEVKARVEAEKKFAASLKVRTPKELSDKKDDAEKARNETQEKMAEARESMNVARAADQTNRTPETRDALNKATEEYQKARNEFRDIQKEVTAVNKRIAEHEQQYQKDYVEQVERGGMIKRLVGKEGSKSNALWRQAVGKAVRDDMKKGSKERHATEAIKELLKDEGGSAGAGGGTPPAGGATTT